MIESIHIGNNYPGTGNDLTWCVKDSIDLSSKFKSFGFTTYVFNEVGREQFMDELYGLVHRYNNGFNKGFVFTHSGHGTRKYDINEPDYYSEALYFTDGIVVDDEIGEIINQIPEGCPNFIFFDACHSGGAMRLLGGDKIRYVPPIMTIPNAKLKKRRDVYGNEVYLSGCLSHEYSYDAGALQNGAATYYLKNAIRQNSTFNDWIRYIRSNLPSQEYPQSPSLECQNDLKYMIFPGWFHQVTTGIDEITGQPVVSLPVKKSWWKRFIEWIKKILGI